MNVNHLLGNSSKRAAFAKATEIEELIKQKNIERELRALFDDASDDYDSNDETAV